MAGNLQPSKTLIFVFIFVITISSTGTDSLSYSQYKTLISLSHSLMSRVANLRASRGDVSGSTRARLIAERIERGTNWRTALSFGWDYVKNYAWRDMPYSEVYGAVSEMNELMGLLGELTRVGSSTERATWVARNYQNLLRVAKSLFGRLLRVFHQSGPMREMVETMQKEVVDGGLLWDCIELGTNDLKGLIQILKDLVLQFYSTNDDAADL